MVLDHNLPVVTERDFERLSFLVSTQTPGLEQSSSFLSDTLENARIRSCQEIPRSVLTMNSKAVLQDLETNEWKVVTLVYPFNANPREGRLAVDSTLGAKLLAAEVGQVIRFQTAEGEEKAYRVVSIPYQPEAAGDGG